MGTGGVAKVDVCVDCWFLSTRLKNWTELLRAGCPSLSLSNGGCRNIYSSWCFSSRILSKETVFLHLTLYSFTW